ncbi:Na+/H+ antiporter [Beijerinckia indica]|uniref:Na+/H+ antiporter n=1 Tax=Beijerinckia indica subsp. indica (strain ATCC 9039 / DSM 1715 / NCIMB 8712) TaxID=395963 RepID=B2IFM3_BEII9|nr:Na+/H+ antiporter [Beijerinckia indica]ACB94234.1 Na+/H+ antiporter [Beijerinckia indica subsp. indica ATCC 9039]
MKESMTPIAQFELILGLMVAVLGLVWLAQRLRLPQAAMLIIGGIVLALLPWTPDVELDPNLVLILFLPPLLLSSAFFTAWQDFRADLRIILQLAIGAVAFTTLCIGYVAHWANPALPLAACFTLGAIVSPPDAVAVKAVLQHLRLPPRMSIMLEGESLVNDAAALVLFHFAVAAALTGTFDAGHAVIEFILLAAGGVLAGLIFGMVALFIMRHLHDELLVIVSGFLTAWGSYIGGESLLHVSGVLTTVTCGFFLGWRAHEEMDASTRLKARGVWDIAIFLLESMVFILIGLSLRGVMMRLDKDWDVFFTWLPAIGIITGAMIISRFCWIFPTTYIVRWLLPWLRQRDPYPPIAVPLVMSWAGMRGVVTLAVALALPDTFPGRDFILITAFTVILVTVLVQGTTLAPLIRIIGLNAKSMPLTKTLTEAEARAKIAAVQLALVERKSLQPDGTHLHPRLAEQYGYRARVSARFARETKELLPHRNAHFQVVQEAIKAGRAELLRLHRTGAVRDETLRDLEHELDLEEINVQGWLSDYKDL